MAEESIDALTYAWSLMSSSTFTHVLVASSRLGLFDIIARAGPGVELSASEIAAQLPTKNPEAAFFLDRMLRLLACYSLLTCTLRTTGEEDGKVQRLYGLASAGKAFVHSEDGAVVEPFPPHKALQEPWLHLKDFILEGGNIFERVFGMPIYQYMNQDPELNQEFHKVLSQLSKVCMKKILEDYKGFDGLTSLVDVGGGSGTTLNMIVSKYPSIKGINYDLPQVIQNAPSYPGKHHLRQFDSLITDPSTTRLGVQHVSFPLIGVQHIAGDMFVNIPKANALLIKDVLHNWGDERCMKVLKNCYDALPSQGKLIIVNYVMPEGAEPSNMAKHVSQLDVVMFLHQGGRQRTEREFQTLCKAAGFSDFQLVYCVYNGTAVMECRK